MTYEEAIKHFKSLQKRYTKEHNGRMCEKVNLALEALEKQIPKKPRETRCALMCSSCGHKITEKGCKKLNRLYCKKCGQAIDWSDDE